MTLSDPAHHPMPFLLVPLNNSQFSRSILLYISIPVLLSRMFSLQDQSLMPFAWWMSAHLAVLSSSFTSPLKPCQAAPGRADKIFLEPLLYPIRDSIISSVASLFPHHNLFKDLKYVLISFVSLVLSTMKDTEKMLKNIWMFSECFLN